MDVEIVNRVLRLCVEQQTCLFQVSILCNDCLEQHLCTSSKHVLPSIRNYLELFRISPDQSGIEFLMPVRTNPIGVLLRSLTACLLVSYLSRDEYHRCRCIGSTLLQTFPSADMSTAE